MQLPKTLERKFIVPAKAVNELDKSLGEEGDVKIFFGENQIFFDMGKTRLVSRLIEGEFPNYEQVIPKEAKDKFITAKETFLSAVRRTALFTNQESMAVKVEFSRDKVVLSKSASYLGEARVECEADYKGKDISVGFKPDYLINMLKNINQDKVAIELVDSEKPGVVRIGSEYIYVVMPMHID